MVKQRERERNYSKCRNITTAHVLQVAVLPAFTIETNIKSALTGYFFVRAKKNDISYKNKCKVLLKNNII